MGMMEIASKAHLTEAALVGKSVASEASGQSKKRSNPAQAKGPSKKKSKLAETESVSTSTLGEAESTEEVVPQHTARIAPLKAVDPMVPKHLPNSRTDRAIWRFTDHHSPR